MVSQMEFGNATTFFRYTASALYGLGVSTNVFTTYDIIQNRGQKVYYEITDTHLPDVFWYDGGDQFNHDVAPENPSGPAMVN